ncbi:MAG: amidohydrolase family protein [Parasporobacterium sp.]|nr:amidohydrolase family protein [Parasporobacterium sp.]
MIALKNATLIDGSGKEPVKGITILIEKGMIREVGSELAVSKDLDVIDLKGKTVIPGLIDAHIHINGSSCLDRPGASHLIPSYNNVEMREGCLRWGVVAVRTCGQFTEETLAFREGVENGTIERSPRVCMSGPMFQAPGGHPCYTVFMSDPDVEQLACAIVNDDTEIEPIVQKSKEQGVDFTKVFYAHLNKMDYPNPVPRISKNKLEEIIDISHKYGFSVTVHVDSPAEMQDAVELGADCIEHMIGAGETENELSDDLVALTKKSGATVDPTMISIKRFDPLNDAAPSVWDAVKKAVKKCYDAGIPLAVGCDAGIPFVPFGEAVHDEMACLNEAGIPPLEVITMATSGNAKLLNMDGMIGTIEPGKEADLIVLAKDPLEDIRNSKTIELVFSKGRIVTDLRNL